MGNSLKFMKPINLLGVMLLVALLISLALGVKQAQAAQPGLGQHSGYIAQGQWACYTLSASDPNFQNAPGAAISLSSRDKPATDQDLYLFTPGMTTQIDRSTNGAGASDSVLWVKAYHSEVWYCVYGYRAGNYLVTASPTGFY